MKAGLQPYLNVKKEEELTSHLIKASNIGYGKLVKMILV